VLAAEHLVERVGLFLVIVLGESVFGMVTALAAHSTWPSAAAALGGLVFAAMLVTEFFVWGSATAEHGFASALGRGAYEIMREAVPGTDGAVVRHTRSANRAFRSRSSVIVVVAALTEAVSEPTMSCRPDIGTRLLSNRRRRVGARLRLASRAGGPARPRTEFRTPAPNQSSDRTGSAAGRSSRPAWELQWNHATSTGAGMPG
jgi:hypothetical protein